MKPEVHPLEPISDQKVACFTFEIKYPHYTELYQFIADPSANISTYKHSSTFHEVIRTFLEMSTFETYNQHLIIAKRYIRPADHLTRITFSPQADQSHCLSIVTGGQRTYATVGYKAHSSDVFESASADYDRDGTLLRATLLQDSYDDDVWAQIDHEHEQLTHLAIATPKVLTKALELAVTEGILSPTEVAAITSDRTTNRIFKLQDLLTQIFPDLSDLEEFIETQVGGQAFREIKRQIDDRWWDYFERQQSVCDLYWWDKDHSEPPALILFSDHEDYVDNKPMESLVLPPSTSHHELDFYGDRYYLDLLPNATLTFGVKRQRGTEKLLSFPQKLDLDIDFAALTNPESFAWTHFPWHQSVSFTSLP